MKLQLALIVMLLHAGTAESGDNARSSCEDGYQVVEYDVDLTPDVDGLAVEGLEKITLFAVRPGLNALTFSANALDIDQATFDGLPTTVEKTASATVFRLQRPIEPGRSSILSFRFRGRPSRGLYRSKTLIYTSYFTCDWMVCNQERFDERATYTLGLQLTEGTQGFASGSKVGKTVKPGKRVHLQFKTSLRIPAYLAGFIAGAYVVTTSTTTDNTLAFVSDVESPRELLLRFQDTPRIVAFFASRAGVELPSSGYTLALVSGDAAQEAEGHAILGTGAFTGEPSREWAVAHELAHQWWGKLLASESLSEFWLNEGLATFMTAAWKEHAFGRSAYETELDIARQRLAKLPSDAKGYPLAWRGSFPNLSTRRAIQYSKATLFLDALRRYVGEDAFWKGLKRYTRDNAGRLVRSEQFEAAMQAETELDLKKLFSMWVYENVPPRPRGQPSAEVSLHEASCEAND